MAYSEELINSDLDAFKNSSIIRTGAFAFSGVLAGGGQATRTVSITLDNADLFVIFYDSSTKHPDKFKPIGQEWRTLVLETTFGSQLSVDLSYTVTGNLLTIRGVVFNPYSASVALQATTYNFRYIPFEATL